MDVCGPLVSDVHSSEAIKPQSPLNDPKQSTEPFVSLHAVSRDSWRDAPPAPPAQPSTKYLCGIRAISVQFTRLRASR